MAKERRVKGGKKQPAKQPSATQELNEDDLDKVAGGIGYGGKLEASVTTVTDTTATPLITTRTLGYGG